MCRVEGVSLQRGMKYHLHDGSHFDHVLPFSKGGTFLTTSNIQLLYVRHNLEKHDHVE
jgi:hypothetical protein